MLVRAFPQGFPRLAALVTPTETLSCFGASARILLHKQDKLTELEHRLEQMGTNETSGDSTFSRHYAATPRVLFNVYL